MSGESLLAKETSPRRGCSFSTTDVYTAASDSGLGDRSASDRGFGDRSACDRGFRDRSTSDSGLGDRSAGDSGLGDRSASDRGFGDRSASDRGYGDRSAGDRGFGDQSSSDSILAKVDSKPTQTAQVTETRASADASDNDKEETAMETSWTAQQSMGARGCSGPPGGSTAEHGGLGEVPWEQLQTGHTEETAGSSTDTRGRDGGLGDAATEVEQPWTALKTKEAKAFSVSRADRKGSSPDGLEPVSREQAGTPESREPSRSPGSSTSSRADGKRRRAPRIKWSTQLLGKLLHYFHSVDFKPSHRQIMEDLADRDELLATKIQVSVDSASGLRHGLWRDAVTLPLHPK